MITNFRPFTLTAVYPDLHALDIPALEQLRQEWIERGRDNFEALTVIAGVMGDPFAVRTRSYKKYSYTYDLPNGRTAKAEIIYSETAGSFVSGENHLNNYGIWQHGEYSTTRTVSVHITRSPSDVAQVCFLQISDDPGRTPYDEFYIPGAWELPLDSLTTKALARQQEQVNRVLEVHRLELVAYLDRGVV